MEWADLLAQSIHYASEGFPVTPSQEYWTSVNLDANDTEFRALQRFEEFSRVFLKDGAPYKVK